MDAWQEVAEPGQKGILRMTAGPGRHFYNPIQYDVELVNQVEISAGDPSTWHWYHTSSRYPDSGVPSNKVIGNIVSGKLPEVGILTRKSGKPHPDGLTVVPMDSNFKGIIEEVLTPGRYRVNPYEYNLTKVDAVVVPAGFVGVVTNQVGTQPQMVSVVDPSVPTAEGADPAMQRVRPLATAGQRGTLKEVLSPGVYYVNPNVQRVKIVEIGFNEFTQNAGSEFRDTIRFPSKSGFDIELGVTVVWGLHPNHAAQVINEFGATNEIVEKVIKPQLRSICRNEGSLYEARDFIQGDKREEFQQVLTEALHGVCAEKNIELLLALISTIEVRSSEVASAEADVDLKREIQDSFIAIERQITNEKLQATAKKKALLEEARKQVDVIRETIQAETRMKVAQALAEGRRQAAEIEATGRLQVATIEKQIADVDAERVELIGRAESDVTKLANQAEADGKRILVQALGSGSAYNLYTFANNFQPESIRLIFAGEGTFWTDLNRMEELGAAQVVKDAQTRTDRPAGRN
jgi:regulator of protease activity HflC (stomatin/prohibitin superfamily)